MTDTLTDHDLAFLASLGRRSVVATEMALCHEGDRSSEVFLVESGSVRIVRTSSAGRELILATRHGGQLVGELSAFDGRPRSAAMVANEATTIVTIPAERFRTAVENEPRLAGWFLRVLARKLRDADERTLGRDNDDVRTRLVDRLLALADDHAPGAPTATVSARQADLAAWVGSSRETVSRALAELRGQGLLLTGRGVIELCDVHALRNLTLRVD